MKNLTDDYINPEFNRTDEFLTEFKTACKFGENCLLRGMIDISFFRYQYFEAFDMGLRRQLVDVTFIGGICANAIFDDDVEAIEKYTQRIVENGSLISSRTKSAWPAAHNQILKDRIMEVLKPERIRKNGALDSVAWGAEAEFPALGLRSQLWDAENVTQIADTLKKKIGEELVTEEDFHCLAIVRKWGPIFCESCTKIEDGTASYGVDPMHGITTLSYKKEGTHLRGSQEIKFYFFA
ncbi:unnamed protein product, partial [Mesorhabditis spiculigera]